MSEQSTMSWKNDVTRRRFLAGLGITSALPFLESVADPRPARAQPSTRRLKRLVIVAQPHMALGYHRIPEFARGAYGNGQPQLLRIDMALGARVGEFGRDPGRLGGFYGVGAFATSQRLQEEMMVVNGLGCTYASSQGHQSDGNGSWSGGGQGGMLNPRSRFPLSGSLHEPRVTIDHVIGRKIHTSGQRPIYMGNSTWGGGGAFTDESVDFNGAIQSLTGNASNVYNGPIFDAGRKIAEAQRRLNNSSQPTMPADPLAALSIDDFALLKGLEQAQRDRQRLLSDSTLSAQDRRTLEQYYDFLNEGLTSTRRRIEAMPPPALPVGTPGATVSPDCRAPSNPSGGDMGAFLRIAGAAFLCDLSRIALVSFGSYIDHNTEWHAGADGNASKVPIFNTLATQVAQVAQLLAGLTDPETGRDMLENSVVLGITNCSLALNTDGRDPSHSYGDFSYFSVGGSVVLQTGKMFDFMGYNNGRRPAVAGPVPTVNQYLQTLAAAFGCTAADWGQNGFGPWLSSTWSGRNLRVDNAARTQPIPGLLKV